MKKRIKITLRTKIYLTIVTLLALIGTFYAGNPRQLAAVPKSVKAPAGPEVPSKSLCRWSQRARRRGRFPRLIFSRPNSATKISRRSTAMGNSSVLAQIPGPVGPCIEKDPLATAFSSSSSRKHRFDSARQFHHTRR